MGKNILIIQNITREGFGLLDGELANRDVAVTVINLDNGESLPSHIDYDALVVLGGPDSANDTNEKILGELDYIGKFVKSGKPYLGICLGLQLLVSAMGGDTVQGEIKEIGFIDPEGDDYTVELTPEGIASPLFFGLGSVLDVFQLHGETVALAGDMTVLATGENCKNQVVRVGENAYGTQCHFEVTSEMFETWITQDPDLLALDTDELRAQYAQKKENYTAVGKKLCNNFLDIAGIEMK